MCQVIWRISISKFNRFFAINLNSSSGFVKYIFSSVLSFIFYLFVWKTNNNHCKSKHCSCRWYRAKRRAQKRNSELRQGAYRTLQVPPNRRIPGRTAQDHLRQDSEKQAVTENSGWRLSQLHQPPTGHNEGLIER